MKGAAILSIFALALSAFAMPADFARRGGGGGGGDVGSWSGGGGGGGSGSGGWGSSSGGGSGGSSGHEGGSGSGSGGGKGEGANGGGMKLISCCIPGHVLLVCGASRLCAAEGYHAEALYHAFSKLYHVYVLQIARRHSFS